MDVRFQNKKYNSMVSRRLFLSLFLTLPLAACQTTRDYDYDTQDKEVIYPEAGEQWYVGSIADSPYDIPTINWQLVPREYHRQVVSYEGRERPGTIVIKTRDRHLYLVQSGGTAIRYGIGVGKDGFAFKGTARVGRKAAWPGWSPTSNMLKLNPRLPSHVAGGLDNPLGARALYLYQGNRDTLFRIHGTNEPWTIGEAVSSGCIRMMNEDAYDLYKKVPVNAQVVVY